MEIMVFGRRIWFIQRFVGSLAKNMGSNVISSGRVFLKLSSTQSQLEIATFMVINRKWFRGQNSSFHSDANLIMC